MQEVRQSLLVAVLLMAVSGCGGGCNKGGDGDTAGPGGQDCQIATPENGGKYICPEGFFCKYENEKDMLNPNMTGKCAAMAQYKECAMTVPCDSQFSPKCETANESAFCDSLKTTLRCRCEKPGPFTPPVEGGDDGDVKTPTTTK